MKRLPYFITLIACISAILPANAVTEKEMDQARAIATQTYLRYANDGSGYLDDLHPKSMADLEKGLKQKEKENIKAFKSIPVPKDYASWDKKKLVEYWGVTAFSYKGLLEKGRIGKSRAQKRLNAMTVSATDKPAEPQKTETKQESASTPAKEDKGQSGQTAPAAAAPGNPASSTADSTANPTQDPLATPLSDVDEDSQIDKASDHTWVYVIILCILVAVVVALVVFASNVMKKNEAKRYEIPDRQPMPESSVDSNALREEFADTLTSKDNEISSLSKKIESLLNQNATLKSNLEGLTAEVATLRTRLTEANAKIKGYEETGVQQKPSAPQPQQSATTAASGIRSIFLGRANAKGIFVRADRTLNPANSIYRLDTTDGFAGTFRVVSNQTVWDKAINSPIESLSGACSAPDILATAGMTRIVNDSAGTAIFEGGCWKVIRKAKIHYE